MIFVLCSSQIREMALRLTSAWFCLLWCSAVCRSLVHTLLLHLPPPPIMGNSANQKTNNGSSTITSTSTDGTMKNTAPSSSNNNTNQNAKATVSALVGSSSGSSASSMISSFKLLLLAFVTWSFLQMIQWPSTSLVLWRHTMMWDSL